ncbi:hypothetical protein FOVG_16364 [Fusarium oxysporum f. sp. pisi HDV247]|uniref:DUF676 domain-containing protein n=1 Tax=Fusarium oxysporum f. sp. pisi HDV247 TaxID=1080344 RepID=W9NI61_FUSOX|nr:hypothetical protein FOVG_16364 [Fusarium oxysporum f. sp. pisi HDV247]
MGDIVDGAAGVVGGVAEGLRWAGTAASGTIFGLVSDSNENLAIAGGILCRAHDKAWNDFLSKVTRRFLEVVGQPEATTILDAASQVYCKAGGATVKAVVFGVFKCTLMALGQTDFAEALHIWQGIFTNHANTQTMAFILDHKSDLALFLISLLEPAKLYVTALGSSSQNSHARYRQYNELDLTQAMNRHAVICQLQRLAASLSHIVLMGKEKESFEQLRMNTKLRSDLDDNGDDLIPPTLTVTAPSGWWGRSTNHGEKWLFVNGIGGEYFWLQLYCEKLRDTYRRNIQGVFNRSDGLFWDLVECAGERDINDKQNPLIQRTQSSIAAQKILKRELSVALQDRGSDGFVVMIAYSQGCLLLRHVLQEFVKGGSYQAAMANRLRVFTFGNPSIDWMGTDAQANNTPLCEHVNYTEHFANERDFVAALGVLRTNQEEALRRAGYKHNRSSVFINRGEDWVGHLFGTQYSLRMEDYEYGECSKLLACAGGRAMGDKTRAAVRSD